MKHLLFILTLALSVASCAKKDPAPLSTASNTGSYKLDGNVVTCTATASTSSPSTGNVDYLFVSLTTTPQPSTGEEVLTIQYTKPRGQSASSYHPSAYTLTRAQQQPILFDQPTNFIASVLVTSGGGYTGTFAATSQTQSPTIKITEGGFTAGGF